MLHWHQSSILRTIIIFTCTLLLSSVWVRLSLSPFELSLPPEWLFLWQRLQLSSAHVWFPAGGGSALRDDISHPSALLPLLQHSKQLQPATLSLILSFKPLSQGFQQGHKFFSGQSCFLLPFKAWLCFATGPFERWKEKAAAKPSGLHLEGGGHSGT